MITSSGENSTSKKVLQLRMHHVLCCPQFTGHGYNDIYTENLQAIVWLLRENCAVQLTLDPDVICAECPNLLIPDHELYLNGKKQAKKSTDSVFDEGVCALNNNDAVERDSILLSTLMLDGQTIYSSRELFGLIKKRITEEMFNCCCSSCKWKKGKYCSYEKLMTQLEKWTEEDKEL